MTTRRGGYLSLGSTNKSLKILNKSLQEVIETLVTEEEREKLCSIWGARYSGNPSFDTVTLMKSMQTHPSFFKHLLGAFSVFALGAHDVLQEELYNIGINGIFAMKEKKENSKGTEYLKIGRGADDELVGGNVFSDYATQLKSDQWKAQYERFKNPQETIKRNITLGVLNAIPLSAFTYGFSLYNGYFKDYKKSKETVAIIEKAIERSVKHVSPKKTRSVRRR